MAIDTSLFINIISQFKTKGIKDAQKGFSTLDRRTMALNKSLGILARRVAVFETLRRSFNAFVEDDAAARRLNTTLNNLGLSFSALGAEEYISNLERTTAVLDDQLRPAFEQLARVTGDFAQTQSILNTAIDVAAGTGQDVVTVSKALSRAYAGNTTSLSRLNAGLTKAQLATGDFALIQDRLNSLFGGQAADQLDTYQGKVNLIRLGFNNAAEAIGKGMVDALTALGGGDVRNSVNFIVKSGELIGSIFRGIVGSIKSVGDVFGRAFTGKGFFDAESQLELLSKYRKIDDPAKIRASARERRKALEDENKVAAKLARTRAKDAAAQKKAAADQKKAEQDKLKLQAAGDIFDDERISIAAALRNESLDRNEILRLELKRALINENASRADELAEKLRKSQAELYKLADFKPANPFQEWLDAIDLMKAKLAALGTATIKPTSADYDAAQQIISLGSQTGNAAMLEMGANRLGDLVVADIEASQRALAEANLAGAEADFSGAQVRQQAASVNVYVSGTGGLDAETKQAVVDAVVEASSYGIGTNWFRTTNRVAL